MKCYNCGTAMEEEDRFCPMCGSPRGFSEELLAAAWHGNQGAITELYNRTYNSVYQSVRMLVKDEDAALDIVQDTYIRGFQHLNQLENPNRFCTWMKRIGINAAKDYLRKKRPILFSEMEGAEEDDSPELQLVDERQEHLPEIAMDRQETSRLINEILGTLSEEQRFVITMYYYEEMNAREIADLLGTNENTVRSRLNYAKRKIEAKVLEMEKRDGIRLHSLAPISFLLLLLRAQKTSAAVLPDMAVLHQIQGGIRAVYEGAQAAAGQAAAQTAAETAAHVTAQVAAGAATKAISTKMLVGIVAAAVTIGGGGGVAYAVYQENAARKEAESRMEAEAKMPTDEVSEPEEDIVTEITPTPEMVLLTAEEGLLAFGESQSMAAGNSYTGYLVSRSYDYDGQTYYTADLDISEIPMGWLNYQIADLDGDESPELVAATICEVLPDGTPIMGMEVYEWDAEAGKARFAIEISTRQLYEQPSKGMRPADTNSIVDWFLYGEDEMYIGLTKGALGAPIADGMDFEFISLRYYQDETLESMIDPVVVQGSSFYDAQDMLAGYAEDMNRVGVAVQAEQLIDVDTARNISQYVANYRGITKISSESDTEYTDELHQWLDRAYAGQAEPKVFSTIRCEGGSE